MSSYKDSRVLNQAWQPGPEALAHSQAVVAHIQAAIAHAGGSIGFDEFMALALYAPGLGYYSAGAIKFGAGGDFVTAPEISPLFARCLARQCAQVLAQIGGGDILEFGAGSGIMAADLLGELHALDALPNTYQILEVSAELRARQRAILAARVPGLLARVRWLDTWPETGFKGVVLANEVLDALPVKLWVKRAQDLYERRVALDGNGAFRWVEAALAPDLAQRLERLAVGLPSGYQSEINLHLAPWCKGLAEHLAQAVVLIMDYGYPRHEYYHPQRTCGTLLCHYRHRAHEDPFCHPGLQDISANVDFTAVAQTATEAGFRLLGYTSQAQFLLALGIAQDILEQEDHLARLKHSQAIQRLVLPGEMGERFQVMGLSYGISPALQGFSGRDWRARL